MSYVHILFADSVVPEKFRSLGVASAAVVSHTKLMNAALSPSREARASSGSTSTTEEMSSGGLVASASGATGWVVFCCPNTHTTLPRGVRATPALLLQFEAALAGALAYPRCRIPGASAGVDVSCLVDKSMARSLPAPSPLPGRVLQQLRPPSPPLPTR